MMPAASLGAMNIAISGTAMPPEPWPKAPLATPVTSTAKIATA